MLLYISIIMIQFDDSYSDPEIDSEVTFLLIYLKAYAVRGKII